MVKGGEKDVAERRERKVEAAEVKVGTGRGIGRGKYDRGRLP